MAEVNWRRVFIVSSLIFAFLLVCGSIYLHLQQKNHLGRLRHENKVAPIGGVDAAPNFATAAPNAHNEYDIEEQIAYMLNISQQLTDYDYSSEESDYYSNGLASSEGNRSLDIFELCNKLGALIQTEDYPYNMLEQKTLPSPVVHSVKHAADMSETCLQCICETTTGCTQSKCSNSRPCGFFRISHSYWIDAGSPLLEDSRNTNSDSSIESGYHQCVNNVFCAARTVYAFVDKYARDCNQDGIIDCRDHIALHINGPTGCVREELASPFYERMERCLTGNVSNDYL